MTASGASRTGCMSELELDRLLAGDDEPALRQRLDACDHCRRRLAELEVARDARMTPDHVARQAADILTRLAAVQRPIPVPWWRRWFVAAPMAVVAAAGLVVLFWARRSPDARSSAPDVIRVKGNLRLEVLLAEPGPPRLLAVGDPVPSGATLSFRAACPRGCSVALFAVGADGVESIADRAPPPWRVVGIAELPVSVTVDRERPAPPGRQDDLIVGVFCDEPQDLSALHAAVEAAYGPAAGSQAAPPLVGGGCEMRSHRVTAPGAPL